MCPDCTPLKTCTKCGHELPATPGHFSRKRTTKDGLRSSCKECQTADGTAYYAAHREEKAAYRAAHREEITALHVIYYAAHREEKLAYFRAYNAARSEEQCACKKAYREAHPEEMKERARRCYEAHREVYRERARRYYWAHREESAEQKHAYYNANRETFAEKRRRYYEGHRAEFLGYWRTRKARKLAAMGTHTTADIQAQYVRQKGRCYWGRKVNPDCAVSLKHGYHVDHVTPLVKKGSNGTENIVLACPSCNLRKGAKHPMEWAWTLL